MTFWVRNGKQHIPFLIVWIRYYSLHILFINLYISSWLYILLKWNNSRHVYDLTPLKHYVKQILLSTTPSVTKCACPVCWWIHRNFFLLWSPFWVHHEISFRDEFFVLVKHRFWRIYVIVTIIPLCWRGFPIHGYCKRWSLWHNSEKELKRINIKITEQYCQFHMKYTGLFYLMKSLKI